MPPHRCRPPDQVGTGSRRCYACLAERKERYVALTFRSARDATTQMPTSRPSRDRFPSVLRLLGGARKASQKAKGKREKSKPVHNCYLAVGSRRIALRGSGIVRTACRRIIKMAFLHYALIIKVVSDIPSRRRVGIRHDR